MQPPCPLCSKVDNDEKQSARWTVASSRLRFALCAAFMGLVACGHMTSSLPKPRFSKMSQGPRLELVHEPNELRFETDIVDHPTAARLAVVRMGSRGIAGPCSEIRFITDGETTAVPVSYDQRASPTSGVVSEALTADLPAAIIVRLAAAREVGVELCGESIALHPREVLYLKAFYRTWHRQLLEERPTARIPQPPPRTDDEPLPWEPGCCMHCDGGMPCGNGCISRGMSCYEPPGCAC